MSFKEYLQEQEDLIVVQAEADKKEKLANFIRTVEKLNDEAFHAFAKEELGMEEDEAETLAYKMLKAFLTTNDENEDGIPDDLLVGGDEDDEDGEGFEEEPEPEM